MDDKEKAATAPTRDTEVEAVIEKAHNQLYLGATVTAPEAAPVSKKSGSSKK